METSKGNEHFKTSYFLCKVINIFEFLPSDIAFIHFGSKQVHAIQIISIKHYLVNDKRNG